MALEVGGDNVDSKKYKTTSSNHQQHNIETLKRKYGLVIIFFCKIVRIRLQCTDYPIRTILCTYT